MVMFEKANPPVLPQGAAESYETASHDVATPLRAIRWSDLTARLSAARDLRQLLREDVNAKLRHEKGEGDIDFANAAARFFRANEEDQRAVNHMGLEPGKTSSGMYAIGTNGPKMEIPNAEPTPTAHCEPGDARDKQ